MPLPRRIDLRRLLDRITAFYNAGDAETAQMRGAQLRAVFRLTPYAMLTNLGNVALVVWSFSAAMPVWLWLWAVALITTSGLGMLNWWQRRQRTIDTASPRALHRATWHAGLLAGIWAVMPAMAFSAAGAEQQLLVATLVTGMLGAGAYMLSPLPWASLTYTACFSVSGLVALWRSGHPTYVGVALLLGLYTLIVMVGALASWSKSMALLRSQAEAVRQKRMLAVLLQDFEQNAGDALWETGIDGRLNQVSPRLAELLGASEVELLAQPLLDWLERHGCTGAGELSRALNAGRPFRDLALSIPRGATPRHLQINGKPLLDEKGRPQGWRGVLADVSDKVAGEQRLRELAHTDSLTGLANRVTLREVLAERLEQASPGALLMVDLDHFKGVNDSLGHSVGDELLQAVSMRLRGCVRPQDLVARLGGDEFAVLMAAGPAVHDAPALAQRLVDALAQPFEIQRRRLRIGGSVGVTVWDDGEIGVDELLVRADAALYAAKGAGRGRHEVYATPLGEKVRRRADVETGLRQALALGQLALHWQPKVDIRSWRIVGAEALMRWEHPELGRIDPAEFIGAAEQCGLIDDLGRWALHEACRTAVASLPGLVVSVNVSPLQLREGRFLGQVRDALRESGLNPAQLELEITESVFIDDAHGALEQLHALRGLGVRVALDDFGTGYSSLAYLRRFPFDTLKIDRAFVNEVLLRQDARAIVQMIAQLATTLGMRTVCEGVESPQQLAAVVQAGCHEVQGYLVSRPRAISDFMRLRQGWRDEAPNLPLLH